MSLASTGQTFYIAFAFIRGKKQDSHYVVLECYVQTYRARDLQYPCRILKDKDRELINAINAVCADTKGTSCIWHVGRILLKKASPLVSDIVAIAPRDGVTLLAGFGFEIDGHISTSKLSDEPISKGELQEEFRKAVNKG